MVSTFSGARSVEQSSIRSDIRALQPQIVEWRRHLHQRPELGFQEQLTAQFIAQKLNIKQALLKQELLPQLVAIALALF